MHSLTRLGGDLLASGTHGRAMAAVAGSPSDVDEEAVLALAAAVEGRRGGVEVTSEHPIPFFPHISFSSNDSNSRDREIGMTIEDLITCNV